jgi:hypothetical protein
MPDINHPLPVGTRILSINGESDDNDGVERHTGPNAVGVIDQVHMFDPCNAWTYSVHFPNGTSVWIDEGELRSQPYVVNPKE